MPSHRSEEAEPSKPVKPNDPPAALPDKDLENVAGGGNPLSDLAMVAQDYANRLRREGRRGP